MMSVMNVNLNKYYDASNLLFESFSSNVGLNVDDICWDGTESNDKHARGVYGVLLNG